MMAVALFDNLPFVSEAFLDRGSERFDRIVSRMLLRNDIAPFEVWLRAEIRSLVNLARYKFEDRRDYVLTKATLW